MARPLVQHGICGSVRTIEARFLVCSTRRMSRIPGNVARRNASRVRARDLSCAPRDRSPARLINRKQATRRIAGAWLRRREQRRGCSILSFCTSIRRFCLLWCVPFCAAVQCPVGVREEAGKPASFVRREDIARELTGGFHVWSGLLGSFFFLRGCFLGAFEKRRKRLASGELRWRWWRCGSITVVRCMPRVNRVCSPLCDLFVVI